MSNNGCQKIKRGWQFWVDRGGTFTDIVAKSPCGKLQTKKLLSENPEAYADAALHGIRQFLGLQKNNVIPENLIETIKMGTTVATNALLERKGEPTLLAITTGLRDIIEIGYQARPKTFELDIKKPEVLYSDVVEVNERILENGDVEIILDVEAARPALQEAFDKGIRAIAIVFMHAFRYPQHEKAVGVLAASMGFTQISMSHEVSPLAKIVSRGETTIVDAYLTPILRHYVDKIASEANKDNKTGKLLFMQSSGGLVDAKRFRGRDAILSGPAGGIIGAVHTAKSAGFDKVIGFDMGGTSTDVFHYAGKFEKAYETEVAGVRMRVPMMYIHTVAAGGGSILKYEDGRFRVGPESAGANPGPVSYRRGGKLAVTDINVALGKIQPDFFPKIFGPNQDEAIDKISAINAFSKIAKEIDDGRSASDVAAGFLDIAIEHMAQAIKKITVARGYDVKDYVLNCFGGAGGQHACLVAERLGMSKIYLHPFSGVLSAYGMGLADIRTERQFVIEEEMVDHLMSTVQESITETIKKNAKDLIEQGVKNYEIHHQSTALIRYLGTDTTLQVPVSSISSMIENFETLHMQRFGFVAKSKKIILDTLTIESFGGRDKSVEPTLERAMSENPRSIGNTAMYTDGKWLSTPLYEIENLRPGHKIKGPAIIAEPTGTIIVENNWSVQLNEFGHIILDKSDVSKTVKNSTVYDPVRLEIFNNLFMSIAQQMGLVLQNTSQSVNVKERLDFSCAIFNKDGNLVANAPHVPVHLGSMDSSVKVIVESGQDIRPGDVFVQNNPYNGGSHLPDVTVVSPVFSEDKKEILFYVASRAHHEDIGGIAPGSMSPLGKTILEEGIILDCVKLVDQGEFLTEHITELLEAKPYPARNISQNIADMMAQTAANAAGANELRKLVEEYGRQTVFAYMGYIQEYAEKSVRRLISRLHDGAFNYVLDNGEAINVNIKIDKSDNSATIDFTGTSEQLPNNFNAPAAITNAAVLYVFRCLVDDEIPLNAGCMKPLNIIVPKGSMLNPKYPAAVVAGNVETSQAVTNALFAALGALGSSQGSMNNLTFGNAKYQYYETICSGAPAGPGFDGVDAVHTHMTNTRLTDPEIMEQRYPIILDEFSIRRNSGGHGKWNAGDGIIRRIRFNEDMECSILSGHRIIRPYGLMGGEPGEIGKNWIVRQNGDIEDLGGCAQTEVHSGDTINISSPTGGGFGKCDIKSCPLDHGT